MSYAYDARMGRFTVYDTEVSTVVTVQIIRGKGRIKKSNAALRGVDGDKKGTRCLGP
jgi:hypothetical protein